jgi:hypothetical protein
MLGTFTAAAGLGGWAPGGQPVLLRLQLWGAALPLNALEPERTGLPDAAAAPPCVFDAGALRPAGTVQCSGVSLAGAVGTASCGWERARGCRGSLQCAPPAPAATPHPAGARVGICGDWLHSPCVEGAVLSGLAVADAIAAHARVSGATKLNHFLFDFPVSLLFM